MSSSFVRPYDLVILGAGMAGVTAAFQLRGQGLRLAILEKGRGIGGRMASRRFEDAVFDHGAQFVSVRDARFHDLMQRCLASGVAREWCRGFQGEGDGHARFCGSPAMPAIPKFLAQDLEIHLESRVTRLDRKKHHWQLHIHGWPQPLETAAILSTMPVPQLLALLRAGGGSIENERTRCLDEMRYERCLAVMAVLERPSLIRPPGGIALEDGPVAWLADNQLKGISKRPAVTLHANDETSRRLWHQPRDEVGRWLLDQMAPYLGTNVLMFQVHGWRYSKPRQIHPEPFLVLCDHPTLMLAGDAFAGPKVEGAALSGWSAARQILQRVQ